MKSSLGCRLHGFLTLNFFLKKCVLCVHACMGGIYVHICSCVYPYIQMHGDSNINVVHFPQSLFTLIFFRQNHSEVEIRDHLAHQ